MTEKLVPAGSTVVAKVESSVRLMDRWPMLS